MLKKLVKDVAVYGIGDILVKAISFVQMPIYTKWLLFSKAEIGLWGSAMSVVGLVAAVLALGMDSAYALYFFEAKDDARRRTATSTAILFTLGLTVPVILMITLASTPMANLMLDDSRHRLLLTLAMWLIPFQLIHTLGGQALRNQMRPKPFVALNFLTVLTSVSAGVAVVQSGWGRVEGVMLGSLVGLAMILPVRLWMIRNMLELKIDRALMWKMVAFGAPLVAVALAYWVSGSSSRLVILKMRGEAEAGLFTVAANLTVVLTMVNGALGQAWTPHAFKAHQQDAHQASVLFGRVLTLILAGFGLLCVGFCTFGREGLLILTKSEFLEAETAIIPMALGAYALTTTQVTAMGISISKQTRFLAMIAWVAAGVFIGLSAVLVPRFGFVGCAWAGCAANIILTLIYSLKSQRLVPVTYQSKRIWVLASLTIGGCFASRLLPSDITVRTELLKVGFCVAFAIAAGLASFTGLRAAHPQTA